MSDFDINILVNGSRCKQYHHDGKIFIEAKEGSEYTIEVKNNTWQRILAVCSVDGLSIVDGKPATEKSGGYVINGYAANKYDGFRVSDEKVAKFVFSNKDKKDSYAHSKEDGSEKNVGIVGVRIYREKVKPITLQGTYIDNRRWNDDPYWNQPTIWCGGVTHDTLSFGDVRSEVLGSSVDNSFRARWATNTEIKSGLIGSPLRSMNMTKLANTTAQLSGDKSLSSINCCATVDVQPRGFDMATKWGEAKESKVVEVEFERGVLDLTMDIYYASRQSLIEMGVPIGPEKQVSFPKSFADNKYAKPPKGWNG